MINVAKHALISGRCLSCYVLKETRNSVIAKHFYGMKWFSSNKRSLPVIPIPIKVTNNPDDINVGEELTKRLKKADLLDILNQFFKKPLIKKLSQENGLENEVFHHTTVSFRRFCLESETLPPDLHIIFSDILQGAGNPDDLFPYFLQHAQQIFPHLECIEELKKISDLRLPATWYPEARAINRKIIFHCGPTNSGKTYHALEKFSASESGIYCGPLKLLAVEVFAKTNEKGTLCDLVTGEERRYVNEDNTPANHVSCTVEMASVTIPYDVAVIDEIQMMRDPGRGWAWTRALLGLAAKEIHLCGEEAAIDLVKEIAASVGEEVEVRKYKRMTKLTIEDRALNNLENVQPGDCIVCFNKNDIYNISLQLEKLGKEHAVIYGSLPPGTKLAQSKKFNDPDDSCKILVATDAIGMGLNLSIRRVIFYSLTKPTLNEKGEKEFNTISTSQALQIAGRAGRYGTQFSEGHTTTFFSDDLPVLKDILSHEVNPISSAGLHPTAEQIELFAYYLPHASLSNLIDIFVTLCEVDTASYFMCNIEDFKFLADMIQQVPLPLRARYVFCCAPINKKQPLACTMFLRFARQYSKNIPLTYDWLCKNIGWPLSIPETIIKLAHLEAVFDVLDLYLWLSYRFQDLFPDADKVRGMQRELDKIIQQGVFNITHLLRASTASSHSRNDNTSISRKAATHYHEADDDVEDSASNQSSDELLDQTVPMNYGKLTQRLISQGVLTPDMINQLKEELQTKENETSRKATEKNSKKPRSRHPRK